MDGLADALILFRPLAFDHHVDAVIAQDAQQQIDVRQAGNISQDKGFGRKQARDHQGQGGILGAADLDTAIEYLAAANADAIHGEPCGLIESREARVFVPGALYQAHKAVWGQPLSGLSPVAFLNGLRWFMGFGALPLSLLLLAPLEIFSKRLGQPPVAFRSGFCPAHLHHPGFPAHT
jgi:hypothetical protein